MVSDCLVYESVIMVTTDINLDQRFSTKKQVLGRRKQLEQIQLDEKEPRQMMGIGTRLSLENKTKIIECLEEKKKMYFPGTTRTL